MKYVTEKAHKQTRNCRMQSDNSVCTHDDCRNEQDKAREEKPREFT